MTVAFLGLDFGTESVRALVVDARGTSLASAVETYEHGQIVRGSAVAAARFPAGLGPQVALQHPDDWLESAARAVAAAVASIDNVTIAGIGVDFTSCTMLPALADGTPLCVIRAHADEPHAWPKLWKHHGAADQANRLTERAAARREPWLARYGGVVGVEWFFPKVLEVIESAPEVAAAAEVWLEAGDWFVWMLTGAPYVGGDRGAAELVRSTCQAGYKGSWSRADGFPSRDFLGACHPDLAAVVQDRLPGRVDAPGTVAGPLSAPAAKRLGLPSGIPVSVATIDAHAGVPGAGVAEPGTLVAVLGTSGCHMVMDREEHLIPGVAGVVEGGILPGWFGYETGQAAVGDSFEWVRRLCGAPDHASLAARAAAVPPGADGLVVVDWFNGCRTPLMDPSVQGSVFGASLHHGPAELYRATLEASAFGLAWITEALRDGGVRIDRVVATGGIAREGSLYLQIVAAVLGLPIEVSPVEHGPALGAAILGAIASGEIATAEGAVHQIAGPASAVGPTRTVVPRAGDIAAYEPLYERYRRSAAAVAELTAAGTFTPP